MFLEKWSLKSKVRTWRWMPLPETEVTMRGLHYSAEVSPRCQRPVCPTPHQTDQDSLDHILIFIPPFKNVSITASLITFSLLSYDFHCLLLHFSFLPTSGDLSASTNSPEASPVIRRFSFLSASNFLQCTHHPDLGVDHCSNNDAGGLIQILTLERQSDQSQCRGMKNNRYLRTSFPFDIESPMSTLCPIGL